MKKIFLVCLLVLTTTATAGYAIAATGDSERSAQVWADFEISHYEGGFGFSRYIDGMYSESVYAEFKMDGSGEIYELSILGEEIIGEGDKPLHGLPSNVDGEARDYNLWIYAVNKEEGALAEGRFYKELLLPGDPIAVQLENSRTVQFVPFDLPMGTEPEDLNLFFGEGEKSSFVSWAAGFFLWVDPTLVTSYEIADSRGVVYVRGEIDPLAEEDAQADNIVSLMLPKGITQVSLSDQKPYAQLENVTLEGFVYRGGESVPAQVYFMNLEGDAISVGVRSDESGLPGFIEVKMHSSTGEMPIISSGSGDVSIPSGYQKVTVTVTGFEGKKFFIYFSKNGGSRGKG